MATFLQFLEHEWDLAAALFLLWYTGIGLVIWRLLLNVNGNTRMDLFLPVLRNLLETHGVARALAYCRRRTDVIPRRVFVAGLQAYPRGLAPVQREMDIAIAMIRPDLNFLLPEIVAFARAATLVGLVAGFLTIFDVSREIQAAAGQKWQPSPEISALALVGTAWGLGCALLLMFAVALHTRWVARFETKMRKAAWDLVQALAGGGA